MEKVLIIEKDLTLTIQTKEPSFLEVSKAIIKFSELISSPEYIYTYKISDISVWTAISNGITKEYITDTLTKHSRFPINKEIFEKINQYYNTYLC